MASATARPRRSTSTASWPTTSTASASKSTKSPSNTTASSTAKSASTETCPFPSGPRNVIESYAEQHGTTDGYLLRHPKDSGRAFQPYLFQNQWQRLRRGGELDIPEGMVIYSLRHFFASNCLTHNIPITDVAEWMGHNNIDITFKIYRHLMPGSVGTAAKLLDAGLAA
ncbi:site-specific integrase [Streptomyces sp. NPDC048269]|uniref:site-specific integrase n=1 Tax=Streptomyces sp. NPDC048269 TaxID=3155753 RepID=UPI00343D317F